MSRKAVMVGVLLGLSACGETWAERNVRVLAADDLKCNEDNVKVEEWGPNVYRAHGCHKTLKYSCVQGANSSDTPTCTRLK